MIQINSQSKKVLVYLSLISLFGFGFLFPEKNAVAQESDFCSNISAVRDRAESKVIEKKKELELKKVDRIQKIVEARAEKDKALATKKDTWDGGYQKQFDLISKKVRNESEKQALSVFKTTVMDALNTRRTVVTKATADFRASVDSIISSRKTGLDHAIKKFQSAILLASGNAEELCSSGENSSTAQKEFKLQISLALKDLQSDVKGLVTTKSFDDALDARTKTVDTAGDTFKKALTDALATLKKDFPRAVK